MKSKSSLVSVNFSNSPFWNFGHFKWNRLFLCKPSKNISSLLRKRFPFKQIATPLLIVGHLTVYRVLNSLTFLSPHPHEVLLNNVWWTLESKGRLVGKCCTKRASVCICRAERETESVCEFCATMHLFKIVASCKISRKELYCKAHRLDHVRAISFIGIFRLIKCLRFNGFLVNVHRVILKGLQVERLFKGVLSQDNGERKASFHPKQYYV